MDPSLHDQETQQHESQEGSRSLLEARTLQINDNGIAPITARYRVIYGDALQDDMIASKKQHVAIYIKCAHRKTNDNT